MESLPPIQGQYTVNISGGVNGQGQVAVGSNIRQENHAPADVQPSEADLESLYQALEALRELVSATAPAEKQTSALERVDELATAVTAKKPDLNTMEYVRNWFARNLPGLAGAITSVIVNPIVGRLVEAAGDTLVAEFQRRFGAA